MTIVAATNDGAAGALFQSAVQAAGVDLTHLSPIAQVQLAVAQVYTSEPPSGAISATSITVTPATVAADLTANLIPNDTTITVTKAGTIDGGAKSLYPVRGTVNITAGTTIKEVFAFGVRAAATIAGVIDQTSSTRVGALFAKLDVSAATLTAGQVSVAWFDWGSTASTPTSAECNVIRVQNTTAAVINSLIYGYGKATYFMDLSDNGAGWFVATAPTSLAKSLKVLVNGTTYYVALYTNPS